MACFARVARVAALLAVVVLVGAACGGDGSDDSAVPEEPADADLGVEVSELSPIVDNAYVAFASVTRAVYEGEEVDPENGETLEIRVESTVRNTTATVAGAQVTVVRVLDYEDGELVEQTDDYYAQHRLGDVYYMGERVDEYEDGELVGHGGQWLPGEEGYLAGLFMPADPDVGDEFEQERAPGVAEDRSTVVAIGVSVTVPAGTFDNCIETEDFDPIDEVTEHKFYCAGVGLVREVFAAGGSLELIEYEAA